MEWIVGVLASILISGESFWVSLGCNIPLTYWLVCVISGDWYDSSFFMSSDLPSVLNEFVYGG